MSQDALAWLSRQRRVFDRLDWWPAAAWAEGDAWVVHPGGQPCQPDAALLITPLDVGPGDALAEAQAEVAWVRWCGIADGVSASPLVRDLFARAEARLAARGVRSAWCIARANDWLSNALLDLGYCAVERIVTYQIRIGSFLANDVRSVTSPDTPRPAVAADLDAICALDAEAFAPAWRYPPAIMRCALAQAHAFTIIEQGGALLGYQCALLGGEDGHIVRLAVAPATRRRGAGRALLRDALLRLAQGGAATATLNTPQSNAAAQRLYAALGFRPLLERPRVLMRALAAAEAHV